MKKATTSGSPSKWGSVASSVKVAATLVNKHDRSMSNIIDHEHHVAQNKMFEDELMGHKEGEGQIGDSIERNMNQMVDVLRSKINAMGNAAKTRIRLCEEDLKKNSKESSDQAPKMMEDFDESSNVRGTRDPRYGFNSHKDNLVSAEGVFIDAAHLVIRTKAPTDAAKKLELELEESFASSSLRDMKKMRGKTGMSRTEKSKKSEQKRFEAKKVLRNKSEKDLQTNMENFLTRSVMDTDLIFRAPTLPVLPGYAVARRRSTTNHMINAMKALESNENDFDNETNEDEDRKEEIEGENMPAEDDYLEGFDEEIQSLDPVNWPIAIKWPLKDPRSAHPDNAEGEMDPALLLRYSVEKINLPSGENMFRWLVRQSTIQQYFVYLFWLTKVKFFERDSDPENESFLLRGLSVEYVKIMELLASHGHGAEYEKDFAYQYLPYILANAVYFGFFFLCPGSRHIYTKGFKKTILLQVVKIMHGLQLCTASVKVLWVRLFPEDTHEVDDEVEDVGEIFPVQIAIGNDAKYSTSRIPINYESIPIRTGTGTGTFPGIFPDDDGSMRSTSADSLINRSSSKPRRVSHSHTTNTGHNTNNNSNSNSSNNIHSNNIGNKSYAGQMAGEDEGERRTRGGARSLSPTHSAAHLIAHNTHTTHNTHNTHKPHSISHPATRPHTPHTPNQSDSPMSPQTNAHVNGQKRGSLSRKSSALEPAVILFSSDMQYQWDTRATSLRPSNMTSEGPSSLQNLLRCRSSSTIEPEPVQYPYRGRETDAGSVSLIPSFGNKKQRQQMNIPSLETILRAMHDTTNTRNVSHGPFGANSNNNNNGNTNGSPRKTSISKNGIIPMNSTYNTNITHNTNNLNNTGNTHRSVEKTDRQPDRLQDRNQSRNPTPYTAHTAQTNNTQSSGGFMDDQMQQQWSMKGQDLSETSLPHDEPLNPLARTLLKSTSLRHGHKLTQLTRRQTTETVNMKSVSPLMQEYFVSSVLAPVKMSIGAQLMHRTVPVSWCATGGADTHRRRVVHTDLHQSITDRGKEAEKEFMKASYLGKKNRLDSLRLINHSCASVLKSDAATIGRFSLDLVKRQQQQRKSRLTGPKGEFIHVPPIEAPSSDLLSASDAMLAANFDPADLDHFLANI